MPRLAHRPDVRDGRRRPDGRLAELGHRLHLRCQPRRTAPTRSSSCSTTRRTPGGLMNLNCFTALGKGAADRAARRDRDGRPTTGHTPLEVKFTRRRPTPTHSGEELTYLWDFGVTGSTTDTATALARAHLRDGRATTWRASRRPTRAGRRQPRPSRSRSRAGTSARRTTSGPTSSRAIGSTSNRWQIIRPNDTRPPTVSGGNLNFPIDVGSLYAAGASARNIIVQPLGGRCGRGDGQDHPPSR